MVKAGRPLPLTSVVTVVSKVVSSVLRAQKNNQDQIPSYEFQDNFSNSGEGVLSEMPLMDQTHQSHHIKSTSV